MRYKLRILNRNKFIIAVLLSICVASRIYAVAFTSVGSIGIQNATVCEELNSKYSSLSRLNWCIPLSISLGLNEELLISGFVSCVSINTSLPGKLGTMIDCDYYFSGVVSQYSSHSAHIDTDCSFCIDLGYKFSFNDISIIPFISGKYQRRKYSAWGGYVQIPCWGTK